MADSKKKVQNLKNRIIYIFVTAIVYIILMVMALSMAKPCLKKMMKKDLVLTFTALGEKEEKSEGTTIQINEIVINETNTVDLKSVECTDNWDYWPDPQMLYINNPETKHTVSIYLEDVYSIELKAIGTKSSGYLEVNIEGKEKRINLYDQSEWKDIYIDIYKNLLIYPEEHVVFIVFIVIQGIGAAIVSVIVREKQHKKMEKDVRNKVYFLNIIMDSTLIMYGLESILRESFSEAVSWLGDNIQGAVLETILVALIMIAITLISNQYWLSYLGVFGIIIIYAVACINKIYLRGTPVTPWDIQQIPTLTSVIGGFQPKVNIEIIVVLSIAVFKLIILMRHKLEFRIWSRIRKLLGIVTILIIFVHVNCAYFEESKSINLFQMNLYFNENGYLNTFIELLRYWAPMNEPLNYSENSMELISTEKSDNSLEMNPNILIVLGESFWDISRLEQLDFQENPLKNYSEISKRALYGEAMVNIFGGGTVNSEWEVLTGFSTMFLPIEFMPYASCVQSKNDFSIVKLLEEKGYDSFAIHPYIGSNYNRATAYEYLGINRFITESDFEEDITKIRGYIADEAVFERAFEEGEKSGNTPWVGVITTVQNHGGYGYVENQIQELMQLYPLEVNLDSYAENVQIGIYDLMCGIRAKDAALEKLIDLGERCERPTIIVYFGDHMADSLKGGQSFLDASGLYEVGNDLQEKYEKYRVPFFIWSNYSDYSKDLGIISLSQLLPLAFNEYNLEMPLYWAFLLEMRNEYEACANGIYIDYKEEINSLDQMNQSQQKWLNMWEILQYDYLYGKRYFEKYFSCK